MRGDLADPVDAAVFHRGGGLQAAGDRVLNDDLPSLAQQRDLIFLDLHRPVDLGAFVIKERRDG